MLTKWYKKALVEPTKSIGGVFLGKKIKQDKSYTNGRILSMLKRGNPLRRSNKTKNSKKN